MKKTGVEKSVLGNLTHVKLRVNGAYMIGFFKSRSRALKRGEGIGRRKKAEKLFSKTNRDKG